MMGNKIKLYFTNKALFFSFFLSIKPHLYFFNKIAHFKVKIHIFYILMYITSFKTGFDVFKFVRIFQQYLVIITFYITPNFIIFVFCISVLCICNIVFSLESLIIFIALCIICYFRIGFSIFRIS